jgi:hypothetical protein
MLAGEFVANNSTNITSLESDSFGRMNTKSLGTFIVFAILTSAFSLFGGLTNIVLMVVLIKYVPVVKKIYVYMISLSLSNVLYNFLWQPQMAYNEFPSTSSTPTSLALRRLSATTFVLAGISSLFMATLDKYIFIRFPFVYVARVSESKTIIAVALIWLFCFSFGILRVVVTFPGNDVFAGIILLLFLLTVALQLMIFHFARTKRRELQQLNVLGLNPRNSGEEFRARLFRNKASMTVGLMLAVYIISWLPSTIYRLRIHWFDGVPSKLVTNVKWTKMLLQVHSCINPYVFVFRTKEVRRGVESMLREFGLNQLIIPLLFERSESHVNGFNERPVNNLYAVELEEQQRDNPTGDDDGSNESDTVTSSANCTEPGTSNTNTHCHAIISSRNGGTEEDICENVIGTRHKIDEEEDQTEIESSQTVKAKNITQSSTIARIS